jgi:polyferredoxin
MIQPDDPWGFEEEAVETWSDILKPQLDDLAWLTAFIALAFVSFHRKSVPLKYLTLVVAVGFLGFTKSYLISITNVFSILDWNLPVVKYNLAWYLFFGFAVVSTVLWGRLYCGRVCAFGALTQLMDAALPRGWRVNVPRALELRAAWIKFGLLAAVLTYFVATSNTMVYRYVEPFWMFGMSESAPMWAGLGVLLVATVFVRNLYCRFVCPVGAALGLLSYLTVFRIKRWSECGTCRICQKACEWGAIEGPRILVTECVRCDDCERLYADDTKCPHWRILAYQDGKKVIPLTAVQP